MFILKFSVVIVLFGFLLQHVKYTIQIVHHFTTGVVAAAVDGAI